MIGALAEGPRVLGEPRYLAAAARAADFLLSALRRPDGGLLRTSRAGKAHLPAYLEDYAYLGEALLDLYEAGGESATSARPRASPSASGGLRGREGGFYDTAQDHEALIVRHQEGDDGAIPSANAVAASALARLSFHLDREDFRAAAIGAIRPTGGPSQSIRAPSARACRSPTCCWRARWSWPSSGRRAAGFEALPRGWPAAIFPIGSSRITTPPARRRLTCRCFAGRAWSMGGPRSTSAATSPARHR